MNELYIRSICIDGNTVKVSYVIKGAWEIYFGSQRNTDIIYSTDISAVPESVAIIPFVANILPVAMICNAIIYTKEIDNDFYSNIDNIKEGYQEMYPMLEFGGRIEAKVINNNSTKCQQQTACFFSGGVDAYTTLFRHIEEKPVLMTIWGADIKLEDEVGWKNTISHTNMVAEQFGLQSIWIKSDFRKVINEFALDQLVCKSGDQWWHGFQHGIAIIAHAAPIAYVCGLAKVYIASSYPESMKGMYTCASDPTIDNYVQFCNCVTIHDSYELDRQNKVRYLVAKKNEMKTDIKLRVCWEVSGGKNCCRCEKCYRTILEIVSEGGNPNEYGFSWGDREIRQCKNDMKNKIRSSQFNLDQFYPPIQEMLEKNKGDISDVDKYQWLQEIDFSKFNDMPMKKLRHSIWGRLYRKTMRLIKKKV